MTIRVGKRACGVWLGRAPLAMPEPDAILVARARLGDGGAFGDLVERYLQAAYAVALARVGEPADAEDVCQDAFVTALQRIEECRQPDRFGAWLLSIVRNRAHDYRRYHGRRAGPSVDPETVASPFGNPERDAADARLRKDLLDAMTTLTELQREVLLLFDFEGWNHAEIADKLGISRESARVHLHNGRKALRAKLKPLYKEE